MSDIPPSPTATCGRSASCAPSPTSRARDGDELLALAPRCRPHARDDLPARGANDALDDLRAGRFTGAAVVVP